MLTKSAISSIVGTDISFKSFSKNGAQSLPQRLAVFAQVADGMTVPYKKFEGEGSAAAVGELCGYGSPIHQAALQLYPETGAGASFPVVFIPVRTPTAATPATATISVSGIATDNGSGTVVIGGKKAAFAVAKGDEPAAMLGNIADAISSVLEMPCKVANADGSEVSFESGSLPLLAKWSGKSGNGIRIMLDADVPGLVFSATEFSGGAIDPGKAELTEAFKEAGEVWYTCFLNAWDFDNTDILDLFFDEGARRWSNQVKMPVFSVVGCNAAYADRVAVTDARKEDYINALAVSVASPELPVSIAARQAFFALTTFDQNPAQNVKSALTGLIAGEDSKQEVYSVRNNSIQKGSSTNTKSGSTAVINDFVTMYHPETAGKYPSKRYVVDIVKLQNICYNVRLIMEDEELKGAPLLNDDDITTNPKAVQPKMIVTKFRNLAESLVSKAIIADAAYTKKNLSVSIDDENPKRLNTAFPVKLSGNVEVVSNDIYFAFNFGS